VKYLLDTDTCVFWLKGNEYIEQKVLSVGMDNVALSFINVSELYYGAYKSQRVEANLAMVRRLTEQLNVVESDETVSEMFGELKATLESAGTIIDDADLYIAACSVVHGLTLVTNNTKHFKRIKGIKLQNWV
jgi:predicted nucleic acid-binding protein